MSGVWILHSVHEENFFPLPKEISRRNGAALLALAVRQLNRKKSEFEC